MEGLQFFDRRQEFAVAWKTLPHWAQAGTVCFITWRTGDSLPAEAVRRLTAERREILAGFGVTERDLEVERRARVSERLGYGTIRVSERLGYGRLSPMEKAKLQWKLFTAWDEQLDGCAGECLLVRPELSLIVANSLVHFDGERYVLIDYVVMPNHVHVLAAFADEDQLFAQVTSWKRFTSRQIHSALDRRGEFWQVEQFDHLVRSPEQFEYLRRYVAENPRNAGLREGSFRHYSKAI